MIFGKFFKIQLLLIGSLLLLSNPIKAADVEFPSTSPLSLTIHPKLLKRQLYELFRRTWTFRYRDNFDFNKYDREDKEAKYWPFVSTIVNIVPRPGIGYADTPFWVDVIEKDRKLWVKFANMTMEIEAMAHDDLETIYTMKADISRMHVIFGISPGACKKYFKTIENKGGKSPFVENCIFIDKIDHGPMRPIFTSEKKIEGVENREAAIKTHSEMFRIKMKATLEK